MMIEKGPRGYAIGQETLSCGDVERVFSAIDEAIAMALPESAKATIDVVNFILDQYREHLGEKLVILSDDFFLDHYKGRLGEENLILSDDVSH